MVISQNAILPKCRSPKSPVLLHVSMNFSETFRIDENMAFENTNHGVFLIQAPKKLGPKCKKAGILGFLTHTQALVFQLKDIILLVTNMS